MSLASTLAGLAGGALIGASASLLLLVAGRVAGISGILGGALLQGDGERGWRLWFLAGLLGGGLLLAVVAPATVAAVSPTSRGLLIVAGLLVGVGTQVGGGCTSGHGVCGISRFSPRSLVATATFMLTGAVAVFVGRLLGTPS